MEFSFGLKRSSFRLKINKKTDGTWLNGILLTLRNSVSSSFLTHSSLIIFTAIVMYIGFNKCISCMLASTKVN